MSDFETSYARRHATSGVTSSKPGVSERPPTEREQATDAIAGFERAVLDVERKANELATAKAGNEPERFQAAAAALTSGNELVTQARDRAVPLLGNATELDRARFDELARRADAANTQATPEAPDGIKRLTVEGELLQVLPAAPVQDTQTVMPQIEAQLRAIIERLSSADTLALQQRLLRNHEADELVKRFRVRLGGGRQTRLEALLADPKRKARVRAGEEATRRAAGAKAEVGRQAEAPRAEAPDRVHEPQMPEHQGAAPGARPETDADSSALLHPTSNGAHGGAPAGAEPVVHGDAGSAVFHDRSHSENPLVGGISAGASSVPQPASDALLAYLPVNSSPTSASEKYADDITRIEYIYETAQQTGNGILGVLAPGYLAARDQCDAANVAELGGRLVGAFSVVHGAKAALDQLLRTVPRHSVPGTSDEENLALARTLQAVEAKAPLLAPLLRTIDAMIATTITPHVFRGHEVAGQAIVVSLDGSPMQRSEKLTGELQRTVGMLVLVEDLKMQLLEGKRVLDRASLQAARAKLMPWASRPLDFAFLRAALGPIWEVLDRTASAIESKPSDALADATKQAKHTGWLGDVGQFDINNACNELRTGRRENVEPVISHLYTADPDTRARLLIQIKERGLLDALCSAVGWAEIKELHDSLGFGFAEIKTDLQHYFIGKDGYGPGVGHEWERHNSSLHGLVARLGGAGKVLNFALDVGTFGFNSSYAKALDDRSEGRTSEAEASRDKMHAVGRTAAIAAISMLTGGLAHNWVRGGAAAVSTTRAVSAGAAAGSVGGVSAVATSDAYGNYVSEDQQGFSSPEEYVTALLLGGVIGGVAGGVAQGRSNAAAAKRSLRTSESPASEPPASGERHGSKDLASKAGKAEPSSDAMGEGPAASEPGRPGSLDRRLHSEAKAGLPASEATIRAETVEMELHPEYQARLDEARAKGFDILKTVSDPHVSVVEVVNEQMQRIAIHRRLYLRPRMRFLDLEHEMGHIRQLDRLAEPPTSRIVSTPRGEVKATANKAQGILTRKQSDVAEYHNRLAEFVRLRNTTTSDVLADEFQGIEIWRIRAEKIGFGRADSTVTQWAKQYFPEIPELEAQVRAAGFDLRPQTGRW